MAIYQKFLIRDTDRFDATSFPQLENALEKIVVALNREPAGPKADMLLSFVKDHRIASTSVIEHASVASAISTKTIPVGVLEDLFESSKNNRTFANDLEVYIRQYLLSARLY